MRRAWIKLSALTVLQDGPELPASYNEPRPQRRVDCLAGGVNGVRPCPYVSCRHHNGSDYNTIREQFYLINGWDDGRDTCSLDVADRGAVTLEEAAAIFGVTRERIRQLEEHALRRLERRHPELRKFLEATNPSEGTHI